MPMNSIERFLHLALLASTLPGSVAAQASSFQIEVEGGPAWQTKNDVQIPNDGSATRFSLPDLTSKGPWAAGRTYLTWSLSERHGLRLLYAPLSPDHVLARRGDRIYAFGKWRPDAEAALVCDTALDLRRHERVHRFCALMDAL